ncbi:hypothetical protein AMTRI_Chr03g45880 [Amborella trichopoda]
MQRIPPTPSAVPHGAKETFQPKCHAAQRKPPAPIAVLCKRKPLAQCCAKENLNVRKPPAPVSHKRKHPPQVEQKHLPVPVPIPISVWNVTLGTSLYSLTNSLRESVEDRPSQIAWSSWLLVISLILFSSISKIHCIDSL